MATVEDIRMHAKVSDVPLITFVKLIRNYGTIAKTDIKVRNAAAVTGVVSGCD